MPVQLEEVDGVDQTSGEPQRHRRSEVVSESDVVAVDVLWALEGHQPVVSALLCAGVEVCPAMMHVTLML